jgi:hypothetical protein
MNSSTDQQRGQQIETLQAALKAARENESRWMEISADFSTDPERMEQWSSTAKLRRLEVERIETLLTGAAEPTDLAHPVHSETVETKSSKGETA